MTDVKKVEMPDVLYAEKNIHDFYDAFADKQHVPLTKYVRGDLTLSAEEVTAIREALEWCQTLMRVVVSSSVCVTRGEEMRNAEQIYGQNDNALSILGKVGAK